MGKFGRYFLFACVAAATCIVSSAMLQVGSAGNRTFHRNGVVARTKVSPLRKLSATSENRILVLLAEFPDQTFFYDKTYFENMLTLTAYSHEGATGCAQEYLEKQFGVKIKIDVAGPFKVKGNRHFYGVNNKYGYDSYPGTFVAEACCLADSLAGINFADYDCNGDGLVDNLFVFYAGEDESQQPLNNGSRINTDYMWSHSSTLQGGDYGKILTLDGVGVNSYACTSEIFLRYSSSSTAKSYMAPIGTFIHELMHTFGLSDMYDTDYEKSGGTSAGLWRTTCLMDAGNNNNNGNTPPHLNSIEREMLGIRAFEEIKSGKYTLFPVGSGNEKALRISNPNDSSDFYVLECRSNAASDWDKYIGGKGLLLYHIDRSKDRKSESESYGSISAWDRWSVYNEVNARPDCQCADLVEADGRSDVNPTSSQFSDIKSIFFPQNTTTAIGGTSSVQLKFKDDSTSDYYIYNITLNPDGSVSFSVRDSSSPVPPVPEAPPEASDMVYIVSQTDGTKLILSVSNSVGASVSWSFNGTPIPDPSDFTPSGPGKIKAEIQWGDGTVDCLYAQYTGK